MNPHADEKPPTPTAETEQASDDVQTGYTNLLMPLLAAIAKRVAADHSSADGSLPAPWMGALIALGAALAAASSSIGH
jgi:hypothetical protein